MANEKGGDVFRELAADVRSLKVGARSMGIRMTSLSIRMTSLSDTMSLAAQTLATMARSMHDLGGQMKGNEQLYARLAKVLIVYKSQTDERFEELEERVQVLEATRR